MEAKRIMTTKTDPRTQHQQPPYDTPQQEHPGAEKAMNPQADHGEESYVGSEKLKDATVLITGGDSGIGRAVAIACAREGANVAFGYLNENVDAAETAKWIEKAGRQSFSMQGDLQDPDVCRQLVERAHKKWGRLDVLINNAAYQMAQSSLEDFSFEQVERTYRTNVLAMYVLCQSAVPRMKPGSCIINTASIQAYDPSPELLDYAPTKAAIVNFTKALSKLVIKQGIRVNAVAPGPVWTPLIPSTMPPEKVEQFGTNTLFDRAAQPAELAPLYVWLASAQASYVTGEVFGATGGRSPF